MGVRLYVVTPKQRDQTVATWSGLQLTSPLSGAIITGIVHIPFAWEVFLQLSLQAQLWVFLPPHMLVLPGAPASGTKIIVASPAFQKAFYRYIWQDIEERREAVALKQRLRRSWRRKLIFGLVGLATGLALLTGGWRPWRM